MQVQAIEVAHIPQAAAKAMAVQSSPQDFLAVMMELLGTNGEDMLSILGAGTGEPVFDEKDAQLQNAMQMLSGMFISPQVFGDWQTADEAQSMLTAQAGSDFFLPQTPTAADNPTQTLENAFEIVRYSQNDAGEKAAQPKTSGDMMSFVQMLGQSRQANPLTSLPGKQTEPVDVDELQLAVNELRYLGNATFANRILTAAPDLPKDAGALDILAQVKTGILSQVNSGKNEFVIKLKPEGLGEVTVKMLEAAGKISLSIYTSSQQAQNALNGSISQLQQALKPYNAEITQVVSQQSFLMQEQSFSEHQHNHARQQHSFEGQGNEQTPQREQGNRGQLASILDSYI